MVNNTEDKNRNIRTILFLVLFFILLFSSSGNQGDNCSSSIRNSAETSLLSGGLSDDNNFVLCPAFSLPELNKFCDRAPGKTDLIPFSIPNKISNYNRRTDQSFILMQHTRLTIETTPKLRYPTHHLSDTDDDIPVLS